ncbi:hypothetical protein Tco_1496671, partial [Tanacetum coccineum]
GASVADCYDRLNSLWREFDALTKLPKCTYEMIRSSLFTRELLPKVKDEYIVVSREESRRGVHESSGVTESKINATSFTAKCFELVGFPNGFKRCSNYNTVKQGFNANADLKQNEQICSGTPSSSFTSKQMHKLLSLINETPPSSIHANMACKASFFNGNFWICVSLLSVNKLIRDSRMFVGFDENVERERVWGLVVKVSLWHSRLGHPADQVMSVLKNDLIISKDTSWL